MQPDWRGGEPIRARRHATAVDHGHVLGIPGTVGGFVRMNGGAYGRETRDVLVDCDVVIRSGEIVTLPLSELGYTYRHSQAQADIIWIGATYRGVLPYLAADFIRLGLCIGFPSLSLVMVRLLS